MYFYAARQPILDKKKQVFAYELLFRDGVDNVFPDIDEDEATEQAYYEIAEYVKVSVLLCFSELGSAPSTEDKKTIH